MSFVSHVPCPKCGSSDAGAHYESGWNHCHKCGSNWPDKEVTYSKPRDNIENNNKPKLLVNTEYTPLTSRGIREESCKKWSYGVSKYKGKPCQVAAYKDKDGRVVAQKLRFKDKTFSWLGDPSKATLYGQWLWKEGRGKLVITEGEIDALSVSQVQNHKWAVVSIPNGAQGAAKSIAKQIEFVESFDEVILMFDQDDPGREAAVEVAQLLTPGKARIANLPLKDANECLTNGKGASISEAIFTAKEWRPDEIVDGADLLDEILNYNPIKDSTPYPWNGLNKVTYGYQPGKLITLTAGSGVGKSTFCRELCHHILTEGKQKLGYIALEESAAESAMGIMSVEMNRRIHLDDPDSRPSDEELTAVHKKLFGDSNWYTYKHFGSLESENLFSRIRYLVRGLGCQVIFLDHISIVVSGMSEGDERRTIDNLMTKLRSMTEELGCTMFLVSHLKRKEGTPLEEGGRISLSLLRGSGSIGQLSDTVLGFERDQQDEESKHITRVRVVKNRFAGDSGIACELHYDSDTGRLHEAGNEIEEALDEGEF